MTPIDFYFDFASPYGYLVAEKIDALAARHGRSVRWHPVLLFAVLRQLGMPAPMEHAPKRNYMLLDFDRSARHLGVVYRHPTRFPVITPLPARAFHALAARDPSAAVAFARAAMQAAFQHDQALDDADFLLSLATRFDPRDADTLRQAIDGPEARAALAAAIHAAVARNAFGSPFVIIDGEPFFGADRLPQIEARLAGRLHPSTPKDPT